MSIRPDYPAVYEINAWVWLDRLSREEDRKVTLGDVPQAEIERMAGYGFDALWLMGVWSRSPAARRIAREHPGLQAEYLRALPDFAADDVVGSPYSIFEYRTDVALGGDDGLAAFRERLHRLGLGLILDFVPNHLAIDHPWVRAHPERFVQGSFEKLSQQPWNYFLYDDGRMQRVFAHGRDPCFAGWTDTVQLDYRRSETREAMIGTLLSVGELCDGVRCDMAMLELSDVFSRTWEGEFEPPGAEFWIEAVRRVKDRYPGFLMLAEAYWDLEYRLQELGFDYVYDKRLYDRLAAGDVSLAHAHLRADMAYQRRLARFMENHDEMRAAALFGSQRSLALALLTLALPGLRLVHEGQTEGCRIKLPVQLGRRLEEAPDHGVEAFYRRLLEALRHPVFHEGEWTLIEPDQAWSGNPSHTGFIAYSWRLGEERRLIAVNLSPFQGQCFVPLDLPSRDAWLFCDHLSEARYEREGADIASRGLYLDIAGYGCCLFSMISL